MMKLLNKVDWVGSGASLAWGIYAKDPWFIGGGLVGFVVAWYQPANKLAELLKKRMVRKKAVADDSATVLKEDAFYAEMLGQQPDAEPPKASKAPDFSGELRIASVSISGSRHNALKPSHLNLADSTGRTHA